MAASGVNGNWRGVARQVYEAVAPFLETLTYMTDARRKWPVMDCSTAMIVSGRPAATN